MVCLDKSVTKTLDKNYDPAAIEAPLYEAWEKGGCFKAGRLPNAEPYTIVIPPPNVTGSLHMGHALNNTLQDILCRFERMRGRDVLWQPGTDHAGIATQMLVERQLAEAGEPSRHDMGRAAFVDRIWQWKEESGSEITYQLRRLGASCDWSRERFTLDEGLSQAVRKLFIELYEKGLIYKDKRLVNWDPVLQTAISDLEVVPREINGHLWHFNYPLADDTGHIIVATTRPETMLGDTGVAVHPDDERYQKLIGKMVRLPIVGRHIPIVADTYADPTQGSGAVKITPAHDFNDFEVGKNCQLDLINIFDARACLDLQADDSFAQMADRDEWQGLDRFAARKKIVARLEAENLLAKIEPHTHMVPYGDRSNAVIEPWLTDQWYVDAQTLAAPAIEAVKAGRTKFIPQNWEKTYFEWMENIHAWCISRQLWWGHQIPAWYGEDGEVFVAYDEAEALSKAQAHYGKEVKLTRDPDVLDTWFSSALWPFSTLGWPQDTPELARYYKTDVLVTGFDIIFFWVARMMMMGLYCKGEVPFHTVYIHALVRDEKGAKMSKSKGNVIDPLTLCATYGADALRFTLASMAAMGRDIKLAEARVAGYRNFGTKLWNAARFCQMHGCFETAPIDPQTARLPLNQWIIGALIRTQNNITQALEAYRFNEAAQAIYHFVWSQFCDWYVEFAKPILQDETAQEDAQIETRATTRWVLEHAFRLLHPFMPFVTEALWQETAKRAGMLTLADWPQFDTDLIHAQADEEVNYLIRMITEIRSVRAEMHVPAAAQIPLFVIGADEKTAAHMQKYADMLQKLARLSAIQQADTIPPECVQIVIDEVTLVLPLGDIIDLQAEAERLKKGLAKTENEIQKWTGKLENKGFLNKAPADEIEKTRAQLAETESIRDKLQTALARLQ